MEWLSYTPLQPPLITMTCSKSYYFRQRIVLGALCLFVSSAGTAKTTSVHQVQSTNQTSDTNDASNTPLSGYLPAIIGGGFAIALIGFAAIAARYWGRPVEPAPGPAGDEGGRGSNHDAPRQQAPRPATVVAPLAPPAASLAGGGESSGDHPTSRLAHLSAAYSNRDSASKHWLSRKQLVDCHLSRFIADGLAVFFKSTPPCSPTET